MGGRARIRSGVHARKALGNKQQKRTAQNGETQPRSPNLTLHNIKAATRCVPRREDKRSPNTKRAMAEIQNTINGKVATANCCGA
ncbi:hypothetical protein NDU88_011549 [Pleurodeles waltl]|uniref:Uncharacterized protein n=1 Tax=Pleurodeles waltl TaxID=8319 RepID=A0AAV7R3A9_PLEWA|nr:hypothetical protein NDU88_011549 [Pleurodeles waltl]